MPETEEARNKATIRRLNDAINDGDPGRTMQAIDELVDPDVLIRTPLPIGATGVQALKEVFGMLLRAFPDLHVEIEDLIAEGDRVASRNLVTGTNQGEYLGRPATGRSVEYKEVFIARLTDGRIVETWGVADVLAQLTQLGAIAA